MFVTVSSEFSQLFDLHGCGSYVYNTFTQNAEKKYALYMRNNESTLLLFDKKQMLTFTAIL